MTDSMNELAIGYIRTTHGVRGLLKVESYSGEYDHFLDLKELKLRKDGKERLFLIERFEVYGKGLLLKLKGVDTPEEGKKFSRWEIWVDRSNASELQDNEFYQADLCGTLLVYQGQPMGKVLSVIAGGNGDLLEVSLEKTSEVKLIPFRNEFIGKVDIQGGTLELLEDWVLE